MLKKNIVPVAGVIATGGSSFEWQAQTDWPQFILPEATSYAGFWVKISLRILSEKPLVKNPKLYLDSGSGLSKNTAIFLALPNIRTGVSETVIRFPDQLKSVRLDLPVQAGNFTVKVDLQKKGPISVFLNMVNSLRIQHGLVQMLRKGLATVIRSILQRNSADARRVLLGSYKRAVYPAIASYAEWISANEQVDAGTLANQHEHADKLKFRPKFSIVVPTYNTPEPVLIEFIESVKQQTYSNWELCIADDASSAPHVRSVISRYLALDDRLKVIFRETNGHIAEATNSALALASGDYICLMDHDDTIAPNALYEFALKLNDDLEIDFIYSDEDKLSADGKQRYDPFFKPDWSPEYLESCMYTAHFACYRTEIVNRIGGFRKEFNGAQDYDFVLRFTEHTNKIVHIPKILYHWRAGDQSTAASMDNKGYVIDAAVRALKERVSRTGKLDFVKPSRQSDAGILTLLTAAQYYSGCFDSRRKVEGEPRISIVIPSAGRNSVIRGKNLDLLANCIASIMETATYNNVELVVVDNNDLRPDTLMKLSKYPITFVHYLEPVLNIASKMNIGARHATGEYLLFLNDDIEVITPDWLEAMLSVAQRPGVGAVGAKLYFEDKTLQHVGVAFWEGLPDHVRRGYPNNDPGYFFSSVAQRNYMAVTGACVMVQRELFEEVDGFDEAFAINYNDIDLCLKIWNKGYRIVYAAQAELHHFESQNRVREVAAHEQELFLKRWAHIVQNDPYYGQHFHPRPPNFELRA